MKDTNAHFVIIKRAYNKTRGTRPHFSRKEGSQPLARLRLVEKLEDGALIPMLGVSCPSG